jgi:hypothetical protein
MQVDDERAPLQPLKVPAGWSIEYHDLRELDPATGRELNFRDDLLQLVHQLSGCVVDVGWYPSGDMERGQFAVYVVRGDWATPLHEFRSRDRVRVVAEIERLLVEYGRE